MSNNDISDFDTFISPFIFCFTADENWLMKWRTINLPVCLLATWKKTLGTAFPNGFSIAAKCVLLLKQGNIIGLFFVSHKKKRIKRIGDAIKILDKFSSEKRSDRHFLL